MRSYDYARRDGVDEISYARGFYAKNGWEERPTAAGFALCLECVAASRHTSEMDAAFIRTHLASSVSL